MSTKPISTLGIDFAERLQQREMINITGLVTPSGQIEKNPNFQKKSVWSETSVFAGQFVVYYVRLEDGRILTTIQKSAESKNALVIRQMLDNHSGLEKLDGGPALTAFQACFLEEESPIEEWRVSPKELGYREIDGEWKQGQIPLRPQR